MWHCSLLNTKTVSWVDILPLGRTGSYRLRSGGLFHTSMCMCAWMWAQNTAEPLSLPVFWKIRVLHKFVCHPLAGTYWSLYWSSFGGYAADLNVRQGLSCSLAANSPACAFWLLLGAPGIKDSWGAVWIWMQIVRHGNCSDTEWDAVYSELTLLVILLPHPYPPSSAGITGRSHHNQLKPLSFLDKPWTFQGSNKSKANTGLQLKRLGSIFGQQRVLKLLIKQEQECVQNCPLFPLYCFVETGSLCSPDWPKAHNFHLHCLL